MDELSLLFAETSVERFPEWERWRKEVDSTLEVSVPRYGDGRVLRLVTSPKDITVEFDECHFHIGPFIPFIGTVQGSVNWAMERDHWICR